MINNPQNQINTAHTKKKAVHPDPDKTLHWSIPRRQDVMNMYTQCFLDSIFRTLKYWLEPYQCMSPKS